MSECRLHVLLPRCLVFGVGGYVCDECVSDEALKEFVRDHAEATECSFCDRSADEPIAADTDDDTTTQDEKVAA